MIRLVLSCFLLSLDCIVLGGKCWGPSWILIGSTYLKCPFFILSQISFFFDSNRLVRSVTVRLFKALGHILTFKSPYFSGKAYMFLMILDFSPSVSANSIHCSSDYSFLRTIVFPQSLNVSVSFYLQNHKHNAGLNFFDPWNCCKDLSYLHLCCQNRIDKVSLRIPRPYGESGYLIKGSLEKMTTCLKPPCRMRVHLPATLTHI